MQHADDAYAVRLLHEEHDVFAFPDSTSVQQATFTVEYSGHAQDSPTREFCEGLTRKIDVGVYGPAARGLSLAMNATGFLQRRARRWSSRTAVEFSRFTQPQMRSRMFFPCGHHRCCCYNGHHAMDVVLGFSRRRCSLRWSSSNERVVIGHARSERIGWDHQHRRWHGRRSRCRRNSRRRRRR